MAKRLDEFDQRVASIEVLVVSIEIARVAGQLQAELELAGQPIGRADPIIAATALAHDLELVSGN